VSRTKPRVFAGPASHHSAPNETIVEFSGGAGGGLISLRTRDNNTLTVDVVALLSELAERTDGDYEGFQEVDVRG
jgi:hypothetical protein